MAICNALKNEIRRRYEDSVSPEIRKDYSVNDLSESLGEEALVDALLSGKTIRKCKCCGLPLITSGKGKECYCNRLYDGKRTCKEVGPGISRNSDPITKAMDRARRLHLWRRARNGKTTTACREYDRWVSFALEVESRCREGSISVDELGALIGAGYKEDMAGGL